MHIPPPPRPYRDPWLWMIIACFGGLLAALSILRFVGFNAYMFDLGNMAQAIASVRRGEPLVFTFTDGQMSRLSLHVELFYFLLALPYALWPDPRLLVIIQAALYALAALPAYALAARRLESRAAGLTSALIYLLYPVGQSAVLFDIHGDTLAMPFLLFAIDALDRRAWRAYALWVALALSCKFYVAAPVVVLGLVIWWCYGERRAALLTSLSGIAYGLFAFLVIRPLFTTAETSSIHREWNYLSFYFGQLNLLAQTAVLRIAAAIVVFGPILLTIRRGWIWVLPALPVIIAALFSTVGGSYNYGSHHYAITVPFLVMVAIDGLDRLRRRLSGLAHHPGPPGSALPPPAPASARTFRIELGITLFITALFNLALVDTPLNPRFWSGQPNAGLDPSVYGVTSRDPVKMQFLREQVPPDADIASSLFLAPHLTDRAVLYAIRYPTDQLPPPLAELLPKVDYVVADALFDYRAITPEGFDGGAASEQAEIGQVLRDPAFGLVAARDGVLIFRRDAPPGMALAQTFEVLPDDGRAGIASFGPIELLAARIDPLEGRRFRATFDWRLDDPTLSAVAVSRLEGVPDARIVHLPTYALLPTTEWRPDQVVRESFELELPADTPPGRYLWKVGWYDLGHSEAYATDERSRVGAEHSVITLEVR